MLQVQELERDRARLCRRRQRTGVPTSKATCPVPRPTGYTLPPVCPMHLNRAGLVLHQEAGPGKSQCLPGLNWGS